MPSLVSAVPVCARDRILIIACIVLLTAVAWAYLFHLDHEMSSAMEHDRMMEAMGMPMQMQWTASDLFFTFTMWTVMMTGMMAASATPMLLLFAGAQAGRGERGSLAIPLFGAGYLAVWAGFSACASLAQWGLHRVALLSAAMVVSSPRVGGLILIAAGIYQVTPWKSTCLTHCRSPLGFLMTHWRGGNWGAFRMGVAHGAYCLGCCWALMCVLFAVGVMNLFWVAALAVFVLVEKIGPGGIIVARAAGVALAAFGVLSMVGIRGV